MNSLTIIRFFDIAISLLLLVILSPLLACLLLFGWCDTRSPLFFQERYGINKKIFTVVKFRSMKINTPNISTELVSPSCITAYGRFLRTTKLDELPQLWSVLVGDMTLVGPRPCLPNQVAVINERDRRGIFNVKPGVTGLAQILRVDMSRPKLVAILDARMLKSLSVKSYLALLLATSRLLLK